MSDFFTVLICDNIYLLHVEPLGSVILVHCVVHIQGYSK